MLRLLLPLLTVLTLATAETPKCGQWYSTECWGDSDPRYDPNYTIDLKELHPIWGHYEGYYMVEFEYQFLFPGPIDTFPSAPVIPGQPQTNRNPYGKPVAFYNETIIGSRLYSNRYYIFPPADPGFCLGLPPAMTVASDSNGTCGINGYSVSAASFGVTSYEKDGSIDIIGTTGLYGLGTPFQSKTSTHNPIDNITIVNTAHRKDFVSSATLVLLNDFKELVFSSGNYFLDDQGASARGLTQAYKATKLSRGDWLDMIEAYYNNYTILEEDRVQGGQLPMQTSCVTDGTCPSEEDWCKFDPACSVSPYQEPDAELKAGPLVGIVMAGVSIIFICLLACFRYKLKHTEARARTLLTRRIAETIELRTSNRVLTPEALASEFQKIDAEHDGTISKEELWNFLQSGKAGEITEAEFKVLFSAIDHKHDGQVVTPGMAHMPSSVFCLSQVDRSHLLSIMRLVRLLT